MLASFRLAASLLGMLRKRPPGGEPPGLSVHPPKAECACRHAFEYVLRKRPPGGGLWAGESCSPAEGGMRLQAMRLVCAAQASAWRRASWACCASFRLAAGLRHCSPAEGGMRLQALRRVCAAQASAWRRASWACCASSPGAASILFTREGGMPLQVMRWRAAQASAWRRASSTCSPAEGGMPLQGPACLCVLRKLPPGGELLASVKLAIEEHRRSG